MQTIRIVTWCFLVVLLGGCASLPQPATSAYPFRAEFNLTDASAGEAVSGAVLLESASQGLAQAYGPMGLAVATARIEAGRLSVEDSWGQVLYQTALPLADLPGLLAGELPRRKLLWRSATASGFCLRYVWGQVETDSALRPTRIRLGSATDLQLSHEDGRICLSGTFEGRALMFDIGVLEGGRWQ